MQFIYWGSPLKTTFVNKYAVTALGLLSTILFSAFPMSAAEQVADATLGSGTDSSSLQQRIDTAKQAVETNPTDAKARFTLGEYLRQAGRYREAAREYMESTNLDPTMYVAFHEIAVIDCPMSQVNEATNYLNELKEDKPKELMLRIALSELLERQHNYYQASRELVDMVYINAVPKKFQPKINARIHYLLAKAKEAQIAEKTIVPQQDIDESPAPVPDGGKKTTSPAPKAKSSNLTHEVGHVLLLP